MGLRSFSMSPAFIPSIKELANHVSTADAEQILRRALRRSTTRGVQRLLAEELKRLAPDLALLDIATP